MMLSSKGSDCLTLRSLFLAEPNNVVVAVFEDFIGGAYDLNPEATSIFI